jgi:hypothetical protein
MTANCSASGDVYPPCVVAVAEGTAGLKAGRFTCWADSSEPGLQVESAFHAQLVAAVSPGKNAEGGHDHIQVCSRICAAIRQARKCDVLALSRILAAMLGFAPQRASICNVKAVAEARSDCRPATYLPEYSNLRCGLSRSRRRFCC